MAALPEPSYAGRVGSVERVRLRKLIMHGKFHGNPLIRQVAGRLHVGTPDAEAIEFVRSKFKKAWKTLSEADREAFVQEVLRVHAENQKLYYDVMRGSFGGLGETMRPISVIAREILQDWKKVSPAADHYLQAMRELDSIDDMYYMDTARSVVLYFLNNATSWRGDTARRIKQELRDMVNARSGSFGSCTCD